MRTKTMKEVTDSGLHDIRKEFMRGTVRDVVVERDECPEAPCNLPESWSGPLRPVTEQMRAERLRLIAEAVERRV